MTFKMYRYAVLCAFLVFESSQEVRSENPSSGSDYAGEINPSSSYGFGAPDTGNDGYNPPADANQESVPAPNAHNYEENATTPQVTESRTYSIPSEHSEISVEEQRISDDHNTKTSAPDGIQNETYENDDSRGLAQSSNAAHEFPPSQKNSQTVINQTPEYEQHDQYNQEIPSDRNTINQSDLPPMSEHDIPSSASVPVENVNFDAQANENQHEEDSENHEQHDQFNEDQNRMTFAPTNSVAEPTEYREHTEENRAGDSDAQNHEMNTTELPPVATQPTDNRFSAPENRAESADSVSDTAQTPAVSEQEMLMAPDVLPNEPIKTNEPETPPEESQTLPPESMNPDQTSMKYPEMNGRPNITIEEDNLPVAQTPVNDQQNQSGQNEPSAAQSSQDSTQFPVHPAAIARITPPEFLPTPGIEAPSYNKLAPVLGWSRHLADSASTLKQWLRWWQYLNMKTPVIMPWIDGLNLRIYPDNEVYRAMYVKGIYDPNFSIAINSVLTKGGTFIDAGANIGNYSLLASRVVGEGGHVIAIEPSSRDYDRLVDNIKLNNLDNVIRPYRFALSEKNGEKATLQIANEERSGLNTFGTEFSVKGVTRINTEEVETSTLDSFVERTGLENVEALKMDIEGSELKALHGAINTITRFRPVVMIGVNEASLKASGTTREEVQKFMQDHRYKMYKVSYKPRFAFVPIDDVSKTHAKVLFCFHESLMPPELPQPEHKSLMDYVRDFFSK